VQCSARHCSPHRHVYVHVQKARKLSHQICEDTCICMWTYEYACGSKNSLVLLMSPGGIALWLKQRCAASCVEVHSYIATLRVCRDAATINQCCHCLTALYMCSSRSIDPSTLMNRYKVAPINHTLAKPPDKARTSRAGPRQRSSHVVLWIQETGFRIIRGLKSAHAANSSCREDSPGTDMYMLWLLRHLLTTPCHDEGPTEA
jgi:hypothetical protein